MKQTKTKLRVGDRVAVSKGKDQGKTGSIEKVIASKGQVLVENINMVKKHVKPRGNQQGGIITVNRPISIANVQVVCPTCKKRTRIAFEGEGKEKQRICKKCKAVLEFKKEDKK